MSVRRVGFILGKDSRVKILLYDLAKDRAEEKRVLFVRVLKSKKSPSSTAIDWGEIKPFPFVFEKKTYKFI